jgi:hypothetical protein
MKRSTLLIALLALACGTAAATERYTEARIFQIETSDASVVAFLEVVSGEAPPIGNGGSNESFSKPMLLLANSATDITARNHLLGSAFVAMTQGTVVRFRWEDAGTNAGRVIVMLIRS